mmetsp:Transcript_3565/g.13354  ORF Transcript_3565/g.13354 Transcript_3565/m.13354 type:complete len:236 (+) Transcript_3565:54-761(+)
MCALFMCTRCTILTTPPSPIATRVIVGDPPSSRACAGPTSPGGSDDAAAFMNRCRYVHAPGSSHENSVSAVDPGEASTSIVSSPVSFPRDENESDAFGCVVIAMVMGAHGHSRSSTISRSAVVGIANAFLSPLKTSSASAADVVDHPSTSGAMDACVHMRADRPCGSAASLTVNAASTSELSRSGHRTESSHSPSSGANALRTSMREPRSSPKVPTAEPTPETCPCVPAADALTR